MSSPMYLIFYDISMNLSNDGGCNFSLKKIWQLSVAVIDIIPSDPLVFFTPIQFIKTVFT